MIIAADPGTTVWVFPDGSVIAPAFRLDDADGAPLAVAAEGPVAWWRKLVRLQSKRQTSLGYRLAVRTPGGSAQLVVDKKYAGAGSSHYRVTRPDGEPIVEITTARRNSLRTYSEKLDICDADGGRVGTFETGPPMGLSHPRSERDRPVVRTATGARFAELVLGEDGTSFGLRVSASATGPLAEALVALPLVYGLAMGWWKAPRKPRKRSGLRERTATIAVVAGLAAVVAIVIGVMAYPAIVFYTVTIGDRAVAHVQACEEQDRGAGLDCRGTWRGKDGTEHRGHISGVDADDVGHNVPVRLGPLGPYAGGPGQVFSGFVPGVMLWFMLPLVPVLGWWLARHSRRTE